MTYGMKCYLFKGLLYKLIHKVTLILYYEIFIRGLFLYYYLFQGLVSLMKIF